MKIIFLVALAISFGVLAATKDSPFMDTSDQGVFLTTMADEEILFIYRTEGSTTYKAFKGRPGKMREVVIAVNDINRIFGREHRANLYVTITDPLAKGTYAAGLVATTGEEAIKEMNSLEKDFARSIAPQETHHTRTEAPKTQEESFVEKTYREVRNAIMSRAENLSYSGMTIQNYFFLNEGKFVTPAELDTWHRANGDVMNPGLERAVRLYLNEPNFARGSKAILDARTSEEGFLNFMKNVVSCGNTLGRLTDNKSMADNVKRMRQEWYERKRNRNF